MDSSVTKTMPNLFDLLDHAAAGTSVESWWGPVVGTDEGQSDGSPVIFEMSLVQDETTDGVISDARLKTDVKVVLGSGNYAKINRIAAS